MTHAYDSCPQYRVGQKTGLFLRSHNFATTNDERERWERERDVWYVKSFRILSRMKYVICMSIHLNIICLICINLYPQNCIKFDNDAWVLLNFHSKQGRCLTPMVNSDLIQHDHPLLWQPSSVPLAADQLLGSVCPDLAQPRSRSELAAADQCLKFCDDTPSAATLPALNYPRDLDRDCLAASFLVQWTQAHWNAGKRCVVWTECRRSVLLEHEVVVRNTANSLVQVA